MEKKQPKTQNFPLEQGKILSKTRIFFGLLFLLISVVLSLSFISYLMNWRADQSQAGTMLDTQIRSSNLFGKVGDWLGNLFIFESLGVAAFIVAFLFFVIGLQILKKKIFKPWKTFGHSLFFICWLPIFFGAITKGKGVLSGVYGFQISDFLNSIIGGFGLWVILIASILLYFILEFNLRPSAVKAKFNNIKDNTVGKVKSIIPSSDDDFEADEELEELANDGNEVEKTDKEPILPATKIEPKVAEEISFPNIKISNDVEPISTPHHTSFNEEPEITETKISRPSPFDKKKDDFEFNVEVAQTIDQPEEPTQGASDAIVAQHGLYDHKLDLAKFQMPSVELLKEYGNEEISVNRDELEENKNKIVNLLKNFNVGIAEIKATIGLLP